MLAAGGTAQPADSRLNPGEFSVNLYSLSNTHDLRILVLRTALTYLELAGILRQGTPFYAGYEFRPLRSMADINAAFTGDAARLVQQLFSMAKHGRTWNGLRPDETAEALGIERRRIVRALEVLSERGLVELRASDVRSRYTCLTPDADAKALATLLMERFLKRERAEVDRVEMVMSIASTSGCITNGLAAYFGETREAPCGHCSYCETGMAALIPPVPALPPIESAIDLAALQALRAAYPQALAVPRQAARFLCGLSGPAISRIRQGRNPLYGALEAYRFTDVLAWCEGQS
jgi:ATP-dependent DNA helicase RecQ